MSSTMKKNAVDISQIFWPSGPSELLILYKMYEPKGCTLVCKHIIYIWEILNKPKNPWKEILVTNSEPRDNTGLHERGV